MLADRYQRIFAELREQGWIVNEDIRFAGPLDPTFSTLPLVASDAETAAGGFGGSGGGAVNG